MYDQTLSPTDGSGGSKGAAKRVTELASAFDATVHVLSVVDVRHVGIGMSGGSLTDDGVALSSDPSEGVESGTVGETADDEADQSAL